MNILLVAEDFMVNGVTRHIIDLALGVKESGHAVSVAATPSTQMKKFGADIPFIPLSLCFPESAEKRYTHVVQSLRILVRTITENKIDIIHTHKRYADVLGRIAARFAGAKHISTCHNAFTTYRWFSPFGDITIAPSQAIEHMLLERFKLNRNRIRLIEHGIRPLRRLTPGNIQQQKQALGIGENKKIILSVGHLNRQKDRTTLIEALHLVQANGQLENAVCLLVGEGEEYSKIRALIHTYQLESYIQLLPAMSDIEVLNNIADFCVVSSLYEAGPYVVLEAASLGKPSVGTAVGLIPSFMGNNETGVSVPPGRPGQLADAIQHLLMDPDKIAELGKKALERFQQAYTYDRFIADTISVYQELLAMKK